MHRQLGLMNLQPTRDKDDDCQNRKMAFASGIGPFADPRSSFRARGNPPSPLALPCRPLEEKAVSRLSTH